MSHNVSLSTLLNWWNTLEESWKRLLVSALQEDDGDEYSDDDEHREDGLGVYIHNNDLEEFSPILQTPTELLKLKDIRYLGASYFGGKIDFNSLIEFNYLPNITSLCFEDQNFHCFDNLSVLKKLNSLILIRNDIQDLNFLQSNICHSLEELMLWSVNGDKQLNFDLLSSLERLTSLTLRENDLSNLSFLSSLNTLEDLTINLNSKIVNIETIGYLTNLTSLNLCYNRIDNISPISKLDKLKDLDLERNKIHDISSIIHLKNLTDLTLSYNPIGDFSPLMELPNLNSLYLVGTSISEKQLYDLRMALPNCNIHPD